ncbi:phage resistance protein [Rhodopirellula sp. SM50]|nr:phage resistance protein [Rhodopirellula sp. SM50]PAY16342.1 phage resistance protein [Rhodopirellula sp. SM50]
MTLLKDLIDIPEQVHRGDFVLKLAEDVAQPDKVLDQYVVTDQLVKCFDQALGFVRNAVSNRSSKATYLHGSFGSGKSHFMAVLHLILSGNARARAIPELAGVIQKHNEWMEGKKFLLVPYHMLGSHDMESGVLGSYVSFMAASHPDAPIPPVYMSATIIEDARRERDSYGEEAFFKRLNAAVGSGGTGGWGELESTWDAESFERAASAVPDSEEHRRLVSDLLGSVATSHAEVVSSRGGNFVRFDIGLSYMSQHAANLGYDAVLLFLDELILWLISNSADQSFVKREASKLTALVEAQSTDRPIPLISFVARQRDLRDVVGEGVPGIERGNLGDTLDFQQGRFETITLEDRNLPAIAEKRILKCRDEGARKELDAAFAQTTKVRQSVMNALLTEEGNADSFRKVYPFSPALVQTLVAVSSVLQRERSALKLMLQLLVDGRETLKVGDLVPVGDLFDVVQRGDEAFSPEMQVHFRNAEQLYERKLLPILEQQHGRRETLDALPVDDPKRVAFRNDDRLVKTLLLSALVPDVESLRGLTPERLAALNHGTIRTPIPGREGQEVLRRLRHWAGTVGEIRIGEEANPTISVQLSGVDTESIIKQAEREDNQGNRVRRVRQMLFEQIGIQGEGEFEQYHEFTWRNTKRTCSVLFRNIRELPDASLENDNENDWKLVIDFPFDEPGHGPRSDIAQLQKFSQSHPAGAKTICWLPQFFSDDARKDLGRFVILEHILAGERFAQYASELSPQDRQAAKSLMENQRSILRTRVQNHLDAAYGLESISTGSLDTTHELDQNEQFVSLRNGFDPQPPVAANLADAMVHLLDQALASEYPGAPEFGEEVKATHLRKVQAVVEEAIASPEERALVDKPLRSLVRGLANPLLLGDLGHDKTHFVIGQHWRKHFLQKADSGDHIPVSSLRRWINEPRAMGLPKEAENLIILAFAAQTNRTFFRHGGPWDVTLTSIPDDCELREQRLPTESEWETAVTRALEIFHVTSSPLRSASTVVTLANAAKKVAVEQRANVANYRKQLIDRMSKLGIQTDTSDRASTATATGILTQALADASEGDVIKTLAEAKVETTASAMGECLTKSSQLQGTLSGTNWEIFDAIAKLGAEHQTRAEEILTSMRNAISCDEHVVALGPALTGAQSQALRLITDAAAPSTPNEVSAPPKAPKKLPPVTIPPSAKKRVVQQDTEADLDLEATRSLIQRLEGELKSDQSIRLSVSWIIEE